MVLVVQLRQTEQILKPHMRVQILKYRTGPAQVK